MYEITDYTFKRAKELNIIVKPSINPKYKIDVFNTDGKYLFSGGATGYSDFPTYMKTNLKIAEERRRLYHIRHKKDIEHPYTKGWFISKLLW